jgi:Methyltransferase domain.
VDSQQVREEWAARSGEYSPAYYAYYGSDRASEAVLAAVEDHLGPEPSILEVGCSSGRHLAALYEAGYRDLSGVELNEGAREAMRKTYPELSRVVSIEYAAIESVVADFEDGAFDAVFAVETLQHLHPDSEWVFAELARITDHLFVTVENEGGTTASEDTPVNYVDADVPLYYRDWQRIFTELGFTQVRADTEGRDAIRTFRLDAE